MKEDNVSISVKLNRLKKIVKRVDEIANGENVNVSFEYLVGSCFPQAMDNMKDALFHARTNGYVDGMRDTVNELLDLARKENNFDSLVVRLSEMADGLERKDKKIA